MEAEEVLKVELRKKFAGKWIAVKEGRVVSSMQSLCRVQGHL
jgi:hypothetical protein